MIWLHADPYTVQASHGEVPAAQRSTAALPLVAITFLTNYVTCRVFFKWEFCFWVVVIVFSIVFNSSCFVDKPEFVGHSCLSKYYDVSVFPSWLQCIVLARGQSASAGQPESAGWKPVVVLWLWVYVFLGQEIWNNIPGLWVINHVLYCIFLY